MSKIRNQKTKKVRNFLWGFLYFLICLLGIILINITFSLIFSQEVVINLKFWESFNFDNKVFQFYWKNIIFVFIFFLPYLFLFFIIYYLLFRKKILLKFAILFITPVLIAILINLFINWVLISNNCHYEGITYELGDNYPGDATKIPGTDMQFCRCIAVDGNYWTWMCGD